MEVVFGNIFIRPNKLDEGGVIQGHTHTFDHTTIVFKGSFKLRKSTEEGVFEEKILKAPCAVLVLKDVWHEFTALEDDSVFWCVFAHRDPQSGEVVQNQNGYYGAYE